MAKTVECIKAILVWLPLFLVAHVAYSDSGKGRHYILTHCEAENNPSDIYAQELIKLAFSYSKHTYEVHGHNMGCNQPREVQRMVAGLTDFIWAGTTRELEEKLIPIRIPLYKGMLGYRVLLIRKNNETTFHGIDSLESLKRLKYGQGEGWSDTAILRHSGFRVVTTSEISNLFRMLDAKRFDAFPRGLMEPWDEVVKHARYNFMVEKKILIYYPQPAYIFVSPRKPDIAQLIESGLNFAIKDGSFDNFFYSNSRIKDALEKAKLPERKVFRLNNPFLPKDTPLENKALWLDLFANRR